MDYIKPNGAPRTWSPFSCSSAMPAGQPRSCGGFKRERREAYPLMRSSWAPAVPACVVGPATFKPASRPPWLTKVFANPLAHRRGAGGVAAFARQLEPRTTGTGICTTPSRGPDWLGDQDAIEFMCKKANRRSVIELEHLPACPSDRKQRQDLPASVRRHMSDELRRKAGERTCAAADRTGHAMLHALYQQNVAPTPSSSSNGWRST